MAQKSTLLIAGLISAFVLFVVGGAIAAPALRRTANENAVSAVAARDGISADRAMILAIRLVPGSVPTREAELVNFQGTPAYEVILNSGSVYLDAQTGAVLANTALSQPVASTAPAPQPSGSVLPARFEDTERRTVERRESRDSRHDDRKHDGDDD